MLFRVSRDNGQIGILSLRWKSRVPSLENSSSENTFLVQLLRPELQKALSWSSVSSADYPSLTITSDDVSSLAFPGGWSEYPNESGM